MAESTCCIVASYEAKRYGIRTGTRVSDARRLCPGLRIVHALSALWITKPSSGTLLKVSVVLYDLIPESSMALPLFVEDPRRPEITRAMGSINGRFGKNTVYLAAMHHSLHTAPARIAFSHIPDTAVAPRS